MTDKPEFVDMISAATRQSWRRAPRVIDLQPEVKETSRLAHRSATPAGVADGDVHPLEAQILEVQELGLETPAFLREPRDTRRPMGALFLFGFTNSDSDAR